MSNKENTTNEEWRRADLGKWWYEVSNLGAVRRLAHEYTDSIGRTHQIKEKVWRKFTIHKGYPHIVAANKVSRKVHKLVLLAFSGPRPNGHECRHLNGDKSDNRIENLEWGTHTQNMADRKLHDGYDAAPKGSSNPASKLTESIVSECRGRYLLGDNATALACEFGVSKSAMRMAIRGTTWGHVGQPVPYLSSPK